jgi:LPXTG-site transpeptidase (sortase) family protein
VKQYSRGTLFFLDVVRFGSTFALIFGLLFLTLNYRSFWEIARADVISAVDTPMIGNKDADAAKDIAATLTTADRTSDSGRKQGELLAFLPPVGPPENRLLIPKLNLNVPIVHPATEALLKQDWAQVENDIQTALENGVVHYPGTARPGQAGNFFVTGHSSYYPWAPGEYKNVFARLGALTVGDEYWVYFRGDKHRYKIIQKKEIVPSDVTVLDQPEDKRLSTLMTCTPVGTTLRRLILVAQEIDPVAGTPLTVGDQSQNGVVPKVNLEALPI